jgi:putative transposase
MRAVGLAGVSRRRFVTTTVRAADAHAQPGEDAGFLFLAVVLDVGSRLIVGGSMANHLRTEIDVWR